MPISKRPERLALRALAISIVLLAGTIALGVWSHSMTMKIATLPFTLTVLFSFLSWWRSFLRRRESEEALEHQSISSSFQNDDLFEGQDDSLKMAADARLTFERYFVTGFTIVTGLVIVFITVRLFLTSGAPAHPIRPADALGLAGTSAFLILFSMLTGSFFVGTSREPGCRWLRPVGAWSMFAGFVFALVVIVMLTLKFNYGDYDAGLSRLILIISAVLGCEMISNCILEFYRPRQRDEELKPLYESRFLSFVTEPGGIARNVAYSLDYQFGFKVSETWLYRFLEKSVVPLVMLAVVAMYLLDCITMVDAQQKGIRETYWIGQSMQRTILEPGLHLKLPRPFQVIRKYDVAVVHEINVGFEHGTEGAEHAPSPETPEEMQGDPSGRVIVWNKSHFASEDKFLVASRETHEGENSITNLRDTLGETSGTSVTSPDRRSKSVPVNFIGTTMQVSYRVKEEELENFAYNYVSPERILKDICQAELVHFLANTDLFDVLGVGMQQAQVVLNERIRRAVADQKPSLGIDVVFVGFAGVHPPAEVGEAFQKVLGAQEERESKILRAETDSIARVNRALGQYKRLVADAYGARAMTVKTAAGDRVQFIQQLEAFEQSPSVFKLRKRLDLLEESSVGVRKYLIASDSEEIYIINLEERLRPDMLQDLQLGEGP